MIGSTSLKQKGKWEVIVDYLHDNLNNKILRIPELSELKIWKHIGDEIIFTHTISNIKQPSQIISSVNCLIQAEQNNNDSLLCREKIKFRVACWLAGFHIINKTKTIYVENYEGKTTGFVDYFGPSIDVGFRLAKFSTKEKICISVELALLLIQNPDGVDDLHGIYFEGYKVLKGSMKNTPYPLFWIPTHDTIVELELLGKKCGTHNAIKTCCESFIKDVDDTMLITEPYICNEATGEFIFGHMPEEHKNYDNKEKEYQKSETITTTQSINPKQKQKWIQTLLQELLKHRDKE